MKEGPNCERGAQNSLSRAEFVNLLKGPCVIEIDLWRQGSTCMVFTRFFQDLSTFLGYILVLALVVLIFVYILVFTLIVIILG